MAKRRYKCEPGFERKIDAQEEARIIREIGHRATVKKAPQGGYMVCRTMKRRRRRKARR